MRVPLKLRDTLVGWPIGLGTLSGSPLRGPAGYAGRRPRAAQAIFVLLALALSAGISWAASASSGSLAPRNAGFEEGLRGWRQELPDGFAHGTVDSTEAGAPVGKRCARLSCPPGHSITGLTCDPVKTPKGGAGALVSVRYRTEGTPENLEMRVRPLDDKGQGLVPWQNYQYSFVRFAPSSEWTSLSRPCVIVPDAAAYDITFWVVGEGMLLVDDVRVSLLRPEEYQVPSQAARIKGLGGDDPAVWVESPLKKVYREAKPPTNEMDAVQITAARGECEAFQVVLVPKWDLKQVRPRWQDFLGPSILRRENGRAAWVEYVNVSSGRGPLARTGQTPDPLQSDDKRDLKGGEVQPIWVSFQVPRNARPGLYRGGLRIQVEWRDFFLPVQLRVRDFALPDEPTLTTIARIWKHHPDGRDLMREDLRAHRVAGEGFVGPLPVEVTPDGGVSLDFAPFDEAADTYFRAVGMRLFNFPGVFFGDASGYASRERTWNGLEIASPVFERAFSSYVRQVADHLREKDWLKYAILQLWDEPADAEMREACRRLAGIARAAAPDLRVYLTTRPEPSLFGSVDLWGISLPEGFEPAVIAARRAKGEEIWAYDNRLYSLDTDTSSIDMRAYAWRLKRFGITGVEWWSVSDWTSNPYDKPNQYEPQNGGGFLLYPSRDGNRPNPVDSIRWEQYREGVEDYDALTLLERAHAAARQALKVQDPRFDAGELLERVTRPVALSIADSTRDPHTLQMARAMVDDLVELMSGDPPCLLRFEGDGQKRSVVGVTTPDAEVRNGRFPVRVDSAGRFSTVVGEGTLQLTVHRRGSRPGGERE